MSTPPSKPWRQLHANACDSALLHPVVAVAMEEAIENLAVNFNIPKGRGGVAWCLGKLMSYAAQAARAQALGFDPELLGVEDRDAESAAIRRAEQIVRRSVEPPDSPAELWLVLDVVDRCWWTTETRRTYEIEKATRYTFEQASKLVCEIDAWPHGTGCSRPTHVIVPAPEWFSVFEQTRDEEPDLDRDLEALSDRAPDPNAQAKVDRVDASGPPPVHQPSREDCQCIDCLEDRVEAAKKGGA